MNGRSGPPVDPSLLVDLDAPRPEQPLLLTGLSSGLVLSAAGDVALVCETRGAPIDWGGVYAQGIRLTGPWRVSGIIDGTRYQLPESLHRLRATRWSVESEHRWGPVDVRQELIALPRAPGVARRLSLRSDVPVSVEVHSEFAPYLAPVLVEGLKPYEYHLRTRGPTITAVSHGSGVALDSDPLPDALSIDHAPWIGGSYRGELRALRATYSLDL
ncbi:MAG TPA: hypothetical protein VIZ68_06125, partial [Thermoplasmata archaeon]